MRRTAGSALELRVLLDGAVVADWSGRMWPSPDRVVAAVEKALAAQPPAR